VAVTLKLCFIRGVISIDANTRSRSRMFHSSHHYVVTKGNRDLISFLTINYRKYETLIFVYPYV
jgi:hypothetical protein